MADVRFEYIIKYGDDEQYGESLVDLNVKNWRFYSSKIGCRF